VKRNVEALVAFGLALCIGCSGRSSDQTTTPRSARSSQTQEQQTLPPSSGAQQTEALPATPAAEALTEIRVAQAMIAFKGLADEMCACLSPECGTGVETKIEHLGERFSDLQGTDFTEVQQQELMLAAIRMAQCQAQLLAQAGNG
jgi:hypothetical protein